MNWMEGMIMQHFADEDRKKTLNTILEYIRNSNETNVDITPICRRLNFKPTAEDIEWLTNNA